MCTLCLQGIVKLGYMDADKYRSFIQDQYSIYGVPTLKIFVDKKKPTAYFGLCTANGVVDAAIDAVREKATLALSGGGKNSVKYEECMLTKNVCCTVGFYFDIIVV